MSHPDGSLAAYEDGLLEPGERALVEAHVTSCERCRNEIALARGARDALRSTPDPVTPEDLGGPAFAEMRRSDRRARPAWTRLTPWLAAAAVIGLLAVALPRIGSGGGSASSEADLGAPAAAPSDLRLEIDGRDFDPDSLEAAASAYVRDQDKAGSSEGAPIDDASAAAQVRTVGKARSAEALRCLREAFPGFPGTPVRLVKATFQERPAFLAYVLEGPGAGQPADTISIWVADAKACSILSITSAAL